MAEISAVICELNPIHNGHKYVFDASVAASGEKCVKVAVMSGNFVQRCTPAVFDKYTRAELALRCGADLVFELPFPFSSSGAEFFASASARLAAKLGATSLTFGSESGDADLITRIADVKSSMAFACAMAEADQSDRGAGSAVIFERVMKQFGIDAPVLANDKLASDYVRFGREAGISKFNAVARESAYLSATELREMIFSGRFADAEPHVPREAWSLISTKLDCVCSEERYNDIIFTYLRTRRASSDDGDIIRYALSVARECGSAAELARNLPTKKYTLARVRREILFDMLGVCREDYSATTEFTVLLGASAAGRKYLAGLRKLDGIAVITKPADVGGFEGKVKRQIELSYAADELYALILGKRASAFLTAHPIILD